MQKEYIFSFDHHRKETKDLNLWINFGVSEIFLNPCEYNLTI